MSTPAELKAKLVAATTRAAKAAERLHAATQLLVRGNVTAAERIEMAAAAKEATASNRAVQRALAALTKAAGQTK